MVDQEFVTRADGLEIAGTPLRKFWGKLAEITPRADRDRTMVDLNYMDVEVLELIPGAVYPHPIAQLNIRYTKRERSGWGKLIQSAEKIGYDDLKALLDKRILMEAHMEQYGTNQETNEVIQGLVWEVREVEGGSAGVGAAVAAGPVAPMEVALDLVHGRTQAEFAEAALQNTVLRTPENQKGIFDNSLLSGLVASGQVELEGDRYYVVGRDRE